MIGSFSKKPSYPHWGKFELSRSEDMAEPSEEGTFRSYTPSLAKAYAANRGSYNENLCRVILDNHRSSGGAMKVLLDVGCGPGNSTRPLARYFDSAFGIDPSPEMINTAKALSAASPEETASGKTIDFSIGRAEDMNGPFREPGNQVDLLTSGMAAHWFDMSRFWSSAAACLKPGATVALWAAPSSHCHPSTPNVAKVEEALLHLKGTDLVPFELPGNRLAKDWYENLLLPWNCNPPVQDFLEAEFQRLEWDRDGKLSNPDHFFLGDETVSIEAAKKRLGTASAVTRWREAHPQLAGTEQDVVEKMTRGIKELLGEDKIVFGRSCVLLLFKKSGV
ncbi:S-adenosyl-L-methionine-dependent methyltransferase [Usnea florida]